MKKLRKNIIGGVLCIAVLFCISTPAHAESRQIQTTVTYSIDTPYTYPYVPGTAEWEEFESYTDQVEACQIPEDILKNMTTQALLQTVLDYPFMIDMFIYDTRADGYLAVYNSFNGLRELVSRDDFSYEAAQENAANISQYSLQSPSDADASLRTDYLKMITQFGTLDHRTLLSVQSQTYSYTLATLYTPKGSPVTAFCNQSWDLVGFINGADALSKEKNFMKTHPKLVKKSDPSPTYNCHSYAWYSTSAKNMYWIADPSPYMSDHSYLRVSKPRVGAKAYRKNAKGESIHSGIVTTLNYANTKKPGIRAKCGPYGVFEYSIADDPYIEWGPIVTYWIR